MDVFKQAKLRSLSAALWLVASSTYSIAAEVELNISGKSEQAHRIFAELIDEDGPGCAITAYHKGKVIFQREYGYGHLGLMTPITSASVFDLASTSKQFTAASILFLQRQGKLNLDHNIREYLPEMPDYGKPITIRHLLNHTSGIRDYIFLMTVSGHNIDDVTTQKDALFFIKNQKALDFEPGEKFSYSNSGYLLAAEIVHRVSGLTLKEFAKQNIFDVLHMPSTTYVDSHRAVIKNRVDAYALQDEEFVRDVSYWEQNGDGAVYSTTEDLIKWDAIFYSDEYKWLKDLLYKKGKLNNGEEISYALGLDHATYKGLDLVQHGGAWGGYRSQFARNHQYHFSAVALCNFGHSNPTQLTKKLFDIYLKDFLTDEEEQKNDNTVNESTERVELTSKLIERFVGRFQSIRYPSYMVEVVENDLNGQQQLFIDSVVGKPIPVWPTKDNALVNKNNTRLFWFNSDETITYNEIEWGLAYDVKKLPDVAKPLTDLIGLTGEYYSIELDKTLKIKLVDDKLIAVDKRDNQTRFILIDTETLLTDKGLGVFNIRRDHNGNVTALSMDSYRAKGMIFEKLN